MQAKVILYDLMEFVVHEQSYPLIHNIPISNWKLIPFQVLLSHTSSENWLFSKLPHQQTPGIVFMTISDSDLFVLLSEDNG